jgi:hypothetical protein
MKLATVLITWKDKTLIQSMDVVDLADYLVDCAEIAGKLPELREWALSATTICPKNFYFSAVSRPGEELSVVVTGLDTAEQEEALFFLNALTEDRIVFQLFPDMLWA